MTKEEPQSLELEAENLAREALRGYFGEGFLKMESPPRKAATEKVLILLKKFRGEEKR